MWLLAVLLVAAENPACWLQHRTRVIETHLLPFMCVPFIDTISSWAERLKFPLHLAARSHLRNRFNQPIKKERMKEVWWWWWWEGRITIHVEHEMEIESVHAPWLASFFIYFIFCYSRNGIAAGARRVEISPLPWFVQSRFTVHDLREWITLVPDQLWVWVMERELEPGRMVCACVIEASCFCSKFAPFILFSIISVSCFWSAPSQVSPCGSRWVVSYMACRQAPRGDGRACVCVCVWMCVCWGVGSGCATVPLKR